MEQSKNNLISILDTRLKKMAAQKGTKSVLDYIRAHCPKVFAPCPFLPTLSSFIRLAVGEVEEERGAKEKERKGRQRAGQALSQ